MNKTENKTYASYMGAESCFTLWKFITEMTFKPQYTWASQTYFEPLLQTSSATLVSFSFFKRLKVINDFPLYAYKIEATYLYGMCLLPLTRARITLPSADNERQSPEPPSRFLLRGLTQLPRSMRCNRLRPPDTAKREHEKYKGFLMGFNKHRW